ncbi:MAG: glycosyltransferase family 2 protein [Cyclobacteriaceae bacterium]|nr:glycosyltransferase family 2 protein [Cyclobacteriaceae bacterium SS2]
MKDKYPLISIIALNYNQKEVTCEFLQSLHSLEYPNFEVIVVDNNSTVNPAKDFKSAFSEVKVILSDKNLGFTGGNNLGIENAKGDYYFIVNNDTEVTPDLLDKLLEPFFADDRIAMVSPKIKFYEQPNIIQYAGFHLINPLTGQNGAVGSKEVDNGQHDTPGFTNYAHGAAMLVSKKAVDKVGVLPDQFFIYYEELDWSSQMTRAGYKIYYQASATIYHKESITMGKESSIKAYYHTRNRILFMRRNYEGWQLATFYAFLVAAIIPKALLKYTLTFRTEHLKSFIRAIGWHLSSKNIHNNIV